MHVDLTRDSVAAGDDAYAPHRQSLHLTDDASLGDAVSAALARHYLASIVGGKATWLVVADGTVSAVVAQQWAQPRWLTDARVPAPAAIHFRYLAQRDPDEVYDEYSRQGQP